MRRIMYSVAMSLDGYIAQKDGSYSWIPDEPAIDWGAFMGRFDTMLIGRKTFEVAGGGQGPQPMRTFVFSRTLRPEKYPDVTVVSEDPGPVASRLKQESGKDIWLMGGGELFRSLLEQDLVDAVETAVVPILLGDGIPLLPPVSRSARLALKHTLTYPGGIILLTYDVVREAA